MVLGVLSQAWRAPFGLVVHCVDSDYDCRSARTARGKQETDAKTVASAILLIGISILHDEFHTALLA